MFKNKQFPNEIEKYRKDNTYFLIAFEKKDFFKTSFSPKNSLVVWSFRVKKTKNFAATIFALPDICHI